MGKNQILLLSVSALVVSFISSCGKGSNSSRNDEINNRSSKLSFVSDDNAGNKFCTDLDDETKNPLGKYQWHLKNVGQTSFASNPGTVGTDINVSSVLKDDCISGNGVYVAVVDSGMELAHPSLSPNIDNRPHESQSWSLNFRKNRLGINDPSPISDDDEDHGTMVSGIIGMRSNLGFGGAGVAPRAHLAGYNVISNGSQTFENFLDSLGGSDASMGNDIFSMSYGFSNERQISEDNTSVKASISAFKMGTRQLRHGKGAIYVKAAGNGFSRLGMFSAASCETAVKLKLSCQNSNMNLENSIPEVITVGAINARGVKSTYSTTGSSLWISAPGGEYGVDKEWVEAHYKKLGETINWEKYRATVGEPAIVTTDVSGSRYGASKFSNLDDLKEILSIGNKFNACEVESNKDCNYTNSMNGTSSATPVTSGSIALLLEANPNLTWRDVKYILAKTATKIDADFAGVKINIKDGVTYQAEQGWIDNAAGFHFSNWYGFGLVNVAEGVKLAKNYDVNLGKYIDQNWFPKFYSTANLPVKQADVNGLDSSVSIPKSDSLVIESVQIKVSVESRFIGDVALELTSPRGTKSIIWNAGNAFSSNGNLVDMPLQTNAFYGESSTGEWKLKVINTGLHKADATFKGWKLKISGHK
jgi:subtilisin family serine protease/subtilisin-like proprotein convertase family protein